MHVSQRFYTTNWRWIEPFGTQQYGSFNYGVQRGHHDLIAVSRFANRKARTPIGKLSSSNHRRNSDDSTKTRSPNIVTYSSEVPNGSVDLNSSPASTEGTHSNASRLPFLPVIKVARLFLARGPEKCHRHVTYYSGLGIAVLSI